MELRGVLNKGSFSFELRGFRCGTGGFDVKLRGFRCEIEGC